MDKVTQLISMVGFPCAMCLILVYVIYKLNEQHKEEISKLTATIENNTQALIKLSDKIGVDINVKDTGK